MPESNKKLARRRSLTALISAALIVAVLIPGVLVVAEFTRSDRAKRVIGTYGESGNMFSSNQLTENITLDLGRIRSGDTTGVGARRIIYTSNPDAGATTQITVCNYTQGNRTRRYPSDITYDFYAALVKVTGDNKRLADAGTIGAQTATITFGSTTYTLNSANREVYSDAHGTLLATESASDVFNVALSAGFGSGESGVWLYVLAKPHTDLPGIQPLDAVFRSAVRDAAEKNVWEGYFNEDAAKDPDEFDGFRYVITGIGKGAVTVSWDARVLDLNEIFAAYNGLTYNGSAAAVADSATTGWKELTFDVDSDSVSRYDTQFYFSYGSPEDLDSWTWSTLDGYVTFSFTAAGE